MIQFTLLSAMLLPALDSLVAGLVVGPGLASRAHGRFALWVGTCDGLASMTGWLLPPHGGLSLPDWLGYLLAAPLACLALSGRRWATLVLPVLLASDNLLQPAAPCVALAGAALSAAFAWLGTNAAAACGGRLQEV